MWRVSIGSPVLQFVYRCAPCAEVGGMGLLADMFKVMEDSDSDSDSDVDGPDVKERQRMRNKAKGKTSAWGAIKKYSKAPRVHDDWQVLLVRPGM